MRQQGAVTYSVYSYTERPELETRGDDLGGQWPAFIFHDPLLPKYYPPLYARWGACEAGKRPGAADALRAAQAVVRSQPKWQDPYFWAGWVVWGRPE